ncbi:MAG TPA: TraR/DksA C4-type zinc finger protein [Kofleriaceae bacterium]|nr:TraR/DksA C4-type zinc finger protein [Kofleriaceae bacterium]
MNRTQVAAARKKLLRRGRALLRGSRAAGGTDALGAMAEPELTELREIHAALERIERGIFGRCEDCQGAIEDDHLEEVPWERRCAPCRGQEAAAALTGEADRRASA